MAVMAIRVLTLRKSLQFTVILNELSLWSLVALLSTCGPMCVYYVYCVWFLVVHVLLKSVKFNIIYFGFEYKFRSPPNPLAYTSNLWTLCIQMLAFIGLVGWCLCALSAQCQRIAVTGQFREKTRRREVSGGVVYSTVWHLALNSSGCGCSSMLRCYLCSWWWQWTRPTVY